MADFGFLGSRGMPAKPAGEENRKSAIADPGRLAD
jgi:hypothetical protein